jgi:hypothetical protein
VTGSGAAGDGRQSLLANRAYLLMLNALPANCDEVQTRHRSVLSTLSRLPSFPFEPASGNCSGFNAKLAPGSEVPRGSR